MKLLFIAGREPSYVRNAVMLQALQRNHVEILDCTDAAAGYPRRLARVVTKFLRARRAAFDGVFVGFFGQPLVPLIAALSDKPILFDAFLSAYDTMCFDRKKFAPDSLPGRFFYALDKKACEQAELVLLDTNSYIDYFCSTFDLPRTKFRRVLVGADESLFYPRPVERPAGDKFRVFYYASYLPLHGTEFIVRAAHLLLGQAEVEFVVVGAGPERERIRVLAEELATTNIRFIDWLPYQRLPDEIAQSDVCLGGHFSDIEKAKRVIAGKTYQFIAMRKPVILGDCPGNRELFEDQKNALLVTMADAESLARAIIELRDDSVLRSRLAEHGYQTFLEHGSVEAISREVAQVLAAWESVRGRAGS
jgi:glycosyltransferase involved in cell wall biosynthesis